MYNPLKVSLENIIPLTEARDHFSQIVTEVQKDKLYVLTKGGKPAVALIDVKYLETITGGNVNANHVEAEIQKNPAKVGRSEMIKHDVAPPHPPSPTPPSPKPAVPMPPPPPPPKPTAPMPPPAPTPTIETSFLNPPTPPPAPTPHPPKPADTPAPPSQNVGTLEIHPIVDQDDQEKTPATDRTAPDDQMGPAQYNPGSNTGEPDDMPID